MGLVGNLSPHGNHPFSADDFARESWIEKVVLDEPIAEKSLADGTGESVAAITTAGGQHQA